MIECNEDVMVKLCEQALKQLIKGGKTNTVELKLAAPRAVDLAERLCGMANARGGIVIIVLFLEQSIRRFHSSTKAEQGHKTTTQMTAISFLKISFNLWYPSSAKSATNEFSSATPYKKTFSLCYNVDNSDTERNTKRMLWAVN